LFKEDYPKVTGLKLVLMSSFGSKSVLISACTLFQKLERKGLEQAYSAVKGSP
jgi:hypothetical protein